METESQIIISLTSYKILSLLVGVAFSYMGYRLFIAGIWGHSGDLAAEFGDNRVVLKKAAPGTFFAIFGTVIISFTIYKGLEFKDYTRLAPHSVSYIDIVKDNDELPEKLPF